jgi:DNA-binding SARP family transcriptional activator
MKHTITSTQFKRLTLRKLNDNIEVVEQNARYDKWLDPQRHQYTRDEVKELNKLFNLFLRGELK